LYYFGGFVEKIFNLFPEIRTLPEQAGSESQRQLLPNLSRQPPGTNVKKTFGGSENWAQCY
jgi:hypothetical protein